MKKRNLLLIVTLIVFTFSSCGNKSNNDNSSNEDLLKRIGELEEENKKLKEELNSSNKGEVTSSENSDTNQTDETKIIGGQQKGEGNVVLTTPGGEGNDVTLIVDKAIDMSSIGLDLDSVDVNGNEPTRIYVDGKENTTLQLSKDVQSQNTLMLDKDMLRKGKHTVEVIQEINGQQTFYRQLTYTVKN